MSSVQRVDHFFSSSLTGGELFAKMADKSDSFNEQEVAKIMLQICSAVEHLHKLGIAHRGSLQDACLT